MAGTPISQFNDWVEATGPLYLTDSKYIVNEAQLNTYSFADLTMGDRGKKKMIQGGESIRESIVFEDNGTARFHHPDDDHNWVNPQRLKKILARWRFMIAHMSWTRQEVMLNERMKFGTGDAKFQQYVDLMTEKEMLMWTSKWNLVETQNWATPDNDMESETGLQPMSIPFHINEFPNGLPPGITTKQGLTPTDADLKGKYQPQTETYGVATINDPDNIISAFDRMWKKVRFEMPPTFKEYFTNPAYRKQCIWASDQGHTVYQQLIREHTTDGFEHIAGPQDPSIPNPQYHGIPVKWVSAKTGAFLYDNNPGSTATGFVNEAGEDSTGSDVSAAHIGPRFEWSNTEFMYPVFHDQMYFEKDEITRHHNNPDTYVCPVSTWYNVPCTSLQRQGIVSPSADVYSSIYGKP